MYELKQLENSEVYSLYHRKVANDYQIKNVFAHLFSCSVLLNLFMVFWYI